jgi:isoamylase
MRWDEVDQPLMEFTADVARLRREHPTFRRRRFFTGTSARTGTGEGERLNDIVWLHADGRPMEDADWSAPDARSIGMYLNGHGIAGADARGQDLVDDHFLLYFNAAADDVPLTLPPEEYADAWDVVIDTGDVRRRKGPMRAGVRSKIAGRSVLVLREHSVLPATPGTSAAASVAAQNNGASPMA